MTLLVTLMKRLLKPMRRTKTRQGLVRLAKRQITPLASQKVPLLVLLVGSLAVELRQGLVVKAVQEVLAVEMEGVEPVESSIRLVFLLVLEHTLS
jgi:hypothetical protein